MPTAALISAGIGAAGAIGSAAIGANASKKASDQQVAMQQQALAQQQALFNLGLGKQADYFKTASDTLNPFISAGTSVLPTLQKLITPGADQSATLAQTPGFQFASQYGTKAATNALAARGQGASAGPLATAVSQFNNGLAQDTWSKTVNALMGYAGFGANAGGQLATIAGNAGNADLGASITAGNSQAGTLTNTGNALAAGTLGTANAYMGGINGATGAGTNALLYSKLFGGGGGGGGGLYSGPAYGGGNAFTDSYGGSSSNPLAGLSPSDYGPGF